jgi:hypothetical protein
MGSQEDLVVEEAMAEARHQHEDAWQQVPEAGATWDPAVAFGLESLDWLPLGVVLGRDASQHAI